ncbi:MAG: glycosyltransferase family A protein [bacterium]
MKNKITYIVIGRNEEKNLARCFSSIQKISSRIIYIDSGSVDSSVSIAKKYNVENIIQYKADYSTPAMSRSIGAKGIKTEYIQFLDGDMTLEQSWIPFAAERLEKDPRIAVVHGYKKVYTKNEHDYFILSDKKDWQPDYLQGAYLIRTDAYNRAGGLDGRFPGEEERDLYVRIHSLGYQVWYIHHLMASHYDFKKKNTNIKFLFFSDSAAIFWIPLIKSIKNCNFKSYIFVYRKLLPFLLMDFSTVILLFFGWPGFFYSFIMQFTGLIYALLIKRRGYFIIWKAAFINIPGAIKLYRRKIEYTLKSTQL